MLERGEKRFVEKVTLEKKLVASPDI